jgi:putative ATP-grasp target RiPP
MSRLPLPSAAQPRGYCAPMLPAQPFLASGGVKYHPGGISASRYATTVKESGMSQTLSPAVPFAARGAMLPNLVQLAPVTPEYDPQRQLNTLADGTPWYTTPMAASSTDTNMDGQGDDVSDPYYASAS